MKKQQFNPEEYTKLKHRVEALQLRVKLDFGHCRFHRVAIFRRA